VTTPRPVMFRAGGGAGEQPQPEPAAIAVHAPATGPQVLMADISEFQHDIADAAYLAWSKAVIIRAAYGDQHDDRAWFGGQRRDLLHAGGVKFLGIYQYIVASQDPAEQAAALIRLLGVLRPGEKVIADIEEGSGNLAETWRIWSAGIAGALGDEPWCYSGLNFAAAHGLAPVDWVAAYQSAEPSAHHVLWQFTDAFRVPGVGTCDASVFHGTIDQLAVLAHGGTAPAPAPHPDWTEILMQTLPTLAQGATGEDVRTLQGALIARHYTVAVDGAFGAATKTALQAFQRSAGITADGIAGQHSWTKLLNR
jgi:Putative peptidoglycan binding domain/Glycosyl hydrolases family 25